MMDFWNLGWERFLAAIQNPMIFAQSFKISSLGMVSNSALLGMLFIPIWVGLASSLTHCAGMCAPIHFFIAAKQGRGVFAYHLGRITTYAILGFAAGWLGQGLFQSAPLGNWVRVTASILATVYILMALHWFGILRVGSWLEKGLGQWLAKPASVVLPQFQNGEKAGIRKLYIAGLAGGLLPCPTTQGMLLFAIGLANIWAGAFAMLVMGIGTLPVFIALRPKWVTGVIGAAGPRKYARVYAAFLGVIFVALAVQKVHGAWFTSVPACH